jgi:translation initiation factor IF-3
LTKADYGFVARDSGSGFMPLPHFPRQAIARRLICKRWGSAPAAVETCVPAGSDKKGFPSGECAISTNFRHNEQIRISPVFLIDQNDEKIGSTPTAEALRRSREAGLDLVEVAPMARPPVCKIMDYGKWRYQQQKKQDKSRASARAGQLKELVLKTVKIGDHDLMIKVNHAREFLKEGNKVQFTLRFKGREMAHLDLGRDLFVKIKQELWPVSKIERDAKMEGRRMTLVLQPDHKSPDAKPPVVSSGRAPSPMTAGSGLNLPPGVGRPPAPGAPTGGGARVAIPGAAGIGASTTGATGTGSSVAGAAAAGPSGPNAISPPSTAPSPARPPVARPAPARPSASAAPAAAPSPAASVPPSPAPSATRPAAAGR